jgi:hypothetical protein
MGPETLGLGSRRADRGDVAVKGGITTLPKTAHLAEAFHIERNTIAALG